MRRYLFSPSVRIVVLMTVLTGSCGRPPSVEAPSAEYPAELEEWKQRRDQSLRSQDGWLTLVGLSWLEEGRNTLGSDPTSDVLFPAEVAAALGEILVEHGEVRLIATADSGIQHEGSSVTELDLVSDTEGEPTVLQLGSLSFYVIERVGRLAVRIKDSEAPALAEFSGLDYFPVDAKWRIRATFEPFDEPQTIKVPNVMGTAFEEPVPGILSFTIDGETFRLTPVGERGEELFIVFGDTTNGVETYGGGRFLDTEPPSPDGTVTLDFNAAYNPPCVFTPYATCPLPPAENRLSIAVPVGEKSYGTAH